MNDERKEQIRQQAIDAINWMGSRFFQSTITLNTEEEAVYAAGLWNSKRDGLTVTYFAKSN